MLKLAKKILLFCIFCINISCIWSTENFGELYENLSRSFLSHQNKLFTDFSSTQDEVPLLDYSTISNFLLPDETATSCDSTTFTKELPFILSPSYGSYLTLPAEQNSAADSNQNKSSLNFPAANLNPEDSSQANQFNFKERKKNSQPSFESCLFDFSSTELSNSKTKKRKQEEFKDDKNKTNYRFLEIVKKRKKGIEESSKNSSQNLILDNEGQEKRVIFNRRINYDLTQGQKKAIDEIREDLKSSHSTDRVIIAPVGAGKTEIAMHAALERIIQKQQIVILSPRCSLAEQHFEKFQERFRKIGNVGILKSSYAQSERNFICSKIKSGQYDIILGTHCLLTDAIKYKNLGLVIIDEEQNFGVKDKEFLCNKYPNASTLILTATPIPRTRDLIDKGYYKSTEIETLPQGRLPIIVNRYEFPLEISAIVEAIHFEKSRQGQVFLITNKISKFDELRGFLKIYCPTLTFQTLHGKMKEDEKIEVLKAFREGKFDLLLATSIISVGIDIPNANTIIIHNANTFGLSNLYQIKGRVGRNSCQSYALLLYDPEKISKIGLAKIETIEKHFGLNDCSIISKIDQKLRGSGDVLSTKQHGHYESLNSKSLEILRQELINSNIESSLTPPLLDYQPYYLSAEKEPVYEDYTYKQLFQLFE